MGVIQLFHDLLPMGAIYNISWLYWLYKMLLPACGRCLRLCLLLLGRWSGGRALGSALLTLGLAAEAGRHHTRALGLLAPAQRRCLGAALEA